MKGAGGRAREGVGWDECEGKIVRGTIRKWVAVSGRKKLLGSKNRV